MIVKSPFFYSSFTPSVVSPSILLLEHQLNLFTQFLIEFFPAIPFDLLNIITTEKDTKFLFKKVLNLVCYITVKGGAPDLLIINRHIIANVFLLSFERVIYELFEEKFFNNRDDIFNINACFKVLKNMLN